MKPLRESYQLFVFFYVCPPDKPICRWLKLINHFLTISCVIVLFMALISSGIFVIKNFSTDLANAICAYYQIAGLISSIYSIITSYIKRADIKKIFDNFQLFYDASKIKKKNF